jgi:hypothetical protein
MDKKNALEWLKAAKDDIEASETFKKIHKD